MGCSQANRQCSAVQFSPVLEDVVTRQNDSSRLSKSLSSQDKLSGRRSKKNTTSVASSGFEAQSRDTQDGKLQVIMGKYRMNKGNESIIGEGTSSICRKGVAINTGRRVAIKVYKAPKGKAEEVKCRGVNLQKFQRQVSVLKELQEPLKVPSDPELWHPTLAKFNSPDLFLQLIDHSKDKSKEPGPDSGDGILYLITELAECSLRDCITLWRDQQRTMPNNAVKTFAKAIILVVAGLHAKGFVHCDLKPENLMMFNKRLKLIDVDGCVKIGSFVSVRDDSISFSPCYCAPEWARFIAGKSDAFFEIQPHLDVWSVGMTVCELVTLDTVFQPMYANFLRNSSNHREAGLIFMDWLSQMKKVTFPEPIDKFEPEFKQFLCDGLLVCDYTQRKMLAQCLSNPYISLATRSESKSRKSTRDAAESEGLVDIPSAAPSKHNVRQRSHGEDLSVHAPLHKEGFSVQL